jgi:hypothetical protein
MGATKTNQANVIVSRFIDGDEMYLIKRPTGALILLSPEAARVFVDNAEEDGMTILSIEGEENIPGATGGRADG